MELLCLLAQNDVDGGGLLVGGACFLVWILLAVAALGIWIWALVDAIQNPALDGNQRIIWILVIVLTQFIGALIYLIVGRSRKPAV